MKKVAKLGLALSLLAVSFGLQPPAEAAPRCNPPACFASPGCCFNWQCDAFCGGTGLGYCGASECCTCQG